MKPMIKLGMALIGSLSIGLSAYAAGAKPAPLGPLPPPSIPKDNPNTPEKVELGKKLFWDARLSGDGSSPCVVCHLPQLGWGDNLDISRGYPGTRHWRNSQTILNSAYYNKLFWEGSTTSLEGQAAGAAEGAIAGNGDPSVMEMRMRFLPEYVAEFKMVFGTEWPRMNDAYRAMAAYQRTIVTDAKKVPFDRYMAGDKGALNASQKRGMALYNGKANCLSCHSGPLASDQKFYALGVPDHPAFKNDVITQVTHRWQWYQKGMPESAYRNGADDAGLYYVTKNPKDIGKFRVPSLRELKYTAPYMHNGVLATLADVVDFYDRGGGVAANKSPLIKPLKLSAQEKKDLVAFLEALSMDTPLLHDAPKLPGDYQPLPQPAAPAN
ncbi:MAG TPA: cytochrome c peroxidase [Noviherbaspirillum sp.]|uniref:cytochrome-c peroxidase n=1 Tax=Noviherbaspirillum sp. TaxID=1926288 RepID=UPI002D70E095|nr:cytochrome c peroxidase [Noviherbaspirillum sp.]HYD94551.1 cytochrome c peroxidase [Noviherbaspirillum sp.]